MAVNTKPTQFGTIFDPEMQQDIPVTYSYTPGNVGRMGYVGGDGFENPGEYKWIPSRFDFSDAKYKVNKWGQNEYTMPDGSKVVYNVQNDTVESYIPSNLGKARADVVHSYNGNLLGNPFTYLQPENLTFQGQKVQRGEDVGDTFFLVNPNTYEYVKDAEGNYVLPYDYGSGNGFTNFMTDNGWMLPLAMGAGAAAGAAGLIGGAAEAGAAGAAGGTGLTGGAGGSTGILSGGTVGSISVPTSAGALGLNAAAESAIAAGAGAGLSTGASSFAPAGVGGLNAALPAAGSVGGAGSMSAALPAGTIIGDGTLGTTIGASYAASTPSQFALDALGNAIPASSVGIGSLGGVSGGYDLLSNLGNALKGAQVAKGLLGAGKNPAVNQPMGVQPMQQQQKQYAGVDYSPILNLLAVKSPERTRTSLLG